MDEPIQIDANEIQQALSTTFGAVIGREVCGSAMQILGLQKKVEMQQAQLEKANATHAEQVASLTARIETLEGCVDEAAQVVNELQTPATGPPSTVEMLALEAANNNVDHLQPIE